MAITNKTRKLLWGRSGSRCAFCRARLIMQATPQGGASIVGDECHVVSGRRDGPRYDPSLPSDEVDSYSNLILLCRVHHKMVDDQSETFTADILRQLKENHERWVRESLDAAASSTDLLSADPLVAAFQKVKSAMPDLLSEMKADLSGEGGEFTRDFFLVSKRWSMNYGDPCFAYFYEEHDSLQGKIQVLRTMAL